MTFNVSFDITKRLQQIEIADLLHVCGPCSELPSNINTMAASKFYEIMVLILDGNSDHVAHA